MKKIFAFLAFAMLALNANAQDTHFDFSVTNSTGYDLYYRIVDTENHQIEVTYPCQHNDNYWWGYIKPEGKLILSDTVTYNGIPYAVIGIGDHAFCGCTDLRGELEFPQTIITIGAGAFKGCANLSGNLYLPAAMTRIEDETFSGCSSLSGKLALPDSVQYVGSQAFLNCSGFRGMMMFPATLTFVGNEAFKGCTSINAMSVKPTVVPTTAADAFDNIPTWITINVPYNTLEAYKTAPGWSRFSSHTVEKSIWTGNAEPWTKGQGTEDDPYLIESAENLAWLAQSVNQKRDVDAVTGCSPGGVPWVEYIYHDVYAYQDTCFRLVIDMDLQKGQGLYWKAIGSVHDLSNPDYYGNSRFYTYFSGNFDGNSHVISNYAMYDDYWSKEAVVGYYRGLFGIISGCSICDLTLDKLNINSQKTSIIIGGLAGRAINSTISNCHTTGLIRSGNVNGNSYPVNTMGGIIGFAENCLIQNCTVRATIDAYTQMYNQVGAAGGIVGTMINDKQAEGTSGIIHCNYQGSMVNLFGCAGGIVGFCDGASATTGVIRIENCYSRGTISKAINTWSELRNMVLGGIVGKVGDIDTLFILNCYSNDTITGNSSNASNVNSYAGGLIAKADATTTLYIKNGYHAGPIASKYKGGILAQNTNMTVVRNCYFEAGCAPDDGFGVPMASDYMKTEAFVNRLNNGSTVFRMDTEPYENGGYPVFGTDGLVFVGAEWYYEIQNGDGSLTYQHLRCTADTTVNEKKAKVIVRTNQIYDKGAEVTREIVYEENGVVYWWNNTLEKFTVLYDFGAEVGDEWNIEVENDVIAVRVYEADLQYIDGIPYKRLTIADPNDFFSGILLSRIGHQTSFFPERLMTKGNGYRVDGLRCYWFDNELVLHVGDMDCDAVYEQWHHDVDENLTSAFTIYPNPANNVLFVETQCFASLPDPTYRITNLMGQTLMVGLMSDSAIDVSTLLSGMYFLIFDEKTIKFVKQ